MTPKFSGLDILGDFLLIFEPLFHRNMTYNRKNKPVSLFTAHVHLPFDSILCKAAKSSERCSPAVLAGSKGSVPFPLGISTFTQVEMRP